MKDKGHGGKGAATSATTAALRLLTVRPRSVREMERKLADKGFDRDETHKAIAYLLETGYLDDERFAETLAASRSRHKAWGPARIARDLASRGVDGQTIKKAIAAAMPEDESAQEALRRWRRKNSRLKGPVMRQKAYRHLAARGFSAAAVMKALDMPVEEE